MLAQLFSRARRVVRSLRHSGDSGGSSQRRFRPQIESLEGRCVLATAYLAADLVSDQPGVAPVTDPTLVNAWGISLSPTGGGL